MDNFFKKLESISDKEKLKKTIETGRTNLVLLKGNNKLGFALKLSKWANLHHSRIFAEKIIKDVIDLAKENSSVEAALLLGQNAYFNFVNSNIPEAAYYADLSLKKSRDIESNEAEVKAQIIKGYLCDVRKEHIKASAWYTIALNGCTTLQKPGLLLDLGTSLSKQGEYRQAWSLINEAMFLAKDIAEDKSIDNIENNIQKKILVKAYSRLAPVFEGIGDFDAALRAYDIALSLSEQNNFMHEIFKIYSRKMKLLIMLEDFDGAEEALKKAENVFYENIKDDPKGELYIENDWARLYKDSKNYEKALKKYKEILFGDFYSRQIESDNLNNLMDHQADIFSEILLGIAECFRADGRIFDSETIYSEEAMFSELKQQTGIYGEIDKTYKLRIQKKKVRTILKQLLLNLPDTVEYKNIRAEYDYKEEKVIFRVDKKELKKSKRYFLVFKCLVHNAGKCVSGKILDDFVKDQGEPLNEPDSGLRTYVSRLKKEINLSQFLDKCSQTEGKGWKLKEP
jgi:tetratricopeptide (TPR) repeat protein